MRMKMIPLNPLQLKWVGSMFLVAACIVGLVGLSYAQVAIVEVDPTPITKPFDVDFAMAIKRIPT